MPHPTLARAVVLLAALAALGCLDTPTDGGNTTTPPPPPAAATIRVRYEASGIGAQAPLSLSLDGTPTEYQFKAPKTFDVSVTAGRHELRIGGLPTWCSAASDSITVDADSGAIVPASFTVTCAGFRLRTLTTGMAADSDGYVPVVDADSLARNPLATSGDNLVSIAPGRHTVRLGGVASHCTATPASIDVDVLPTGAVDPVSFSIACAGAEVVATVTTTGADFDGDGYVLALVDPQRRQLALNAASAVATVPLGAWPAGTRFDVVLSGMARNCTSAVVTRPVLVPAADTVRVGFDVTCTALPRGGILLGVAYSDDFFISREITYRLVEPFQESYVARVASAAEWAPDVSSYVFTSGDRLYLGATSSIDVRPLGEGRSPAFSPDGSRLYFASIGCASGSCASVGEAYAIDLTRATSTPQVVFRTTGSLTSFDISPDGTRIAYLVDVSRDFNEAFELRVARLDGTEMRTLLNGVGSARPRFSPDGTQVLAASWSSGFPTATVIGIDGSGRRQVGRTDDGPLAWSPDGSRIIVVSQGGHELVSIRASDGGDRRTLFTTPDYISNASWR